MGNNVSKQIIREYISKTTSLITRFNSVIDSEKNDKRKIVDEITRIDEAGIIIDSVEKLFSSTIPIETLREPLSQLENLLAVTGENKAIRKQLRKYRIGFIAPLEQYVQTLEAASGRLPLIFISNAKRASIDDAITKIDQAFASKELEDIEQLITKYYNSQTQTHLYATKNIRELKKQFRKLGISFSKDSPISIPPADKVIERLNKTPEKINRVLKKSHKEIKDAIEEYLSHEAKKILQEIPVEDLNQNKEGLRVKTLKADGCNTVYDVLHSEDHSIWLNGNLSFNEKWALFTKATKAEVECEKHIKLKLSSDNKTPYTTKIISEITARNLLEKQLEETKEQIEQEKDKISQALESINHFTYCDWFVESNESLAKYRADYQYLNSLGKREFKQWLNSLTKKPTITSC